MSPVLPSSFNPTATPPTNDEAAGKRRIEAVDKVQWLDRLTANADFQRFIEFVNEGAGETRKQAANIDQNEAGKRDAYAQRYFGLDAIARWPAEELARAKAFLRALDEKKPV